MDSLFEKDINITSIATFRSRIRTILESENTSRRKHIVIFGIDGIPYDLALQSWHHAKTTKMRSVFPTTSSSAWLSSLSGMSLDSHGVPGVIFKVHDQNVDLLNIFNYHCPSLNLEIENIFSDAISFGYIPLSILGDLEDYDCAWRDLLLRYSRQISGYKFYTAENDGENSMDLTRLGHDIRQAILESIGFYSPSSPSLLWCFVEIDRHIHRYGYDEHVTQFLELIEQIAIELTQRNAIVVAHSDHGLTQTIHDSRIEQFIEQLQGQYNFSLGGAGRTRWLYLRTDTDEKKLIDELTRNLPPSIVLRNASDLFSMDSLSFNRVGQILLIAQETNFLAPPNYNFDHGSYTSREIYVPFSHWGG